MGIDGELIETGDEELIELSSGCLCCVVRGDLIRTLRALLKRAPALDGILIETTGVANPSPVIQTFTADRLLAGHARLDAVVTLVDAVHIGARLADSPDAIRSGSPGERDRPQQGLRRGRSGRSRERRCGRSTPTRRSTVPTAAGSIRHKVLDTESFSLDRVALDLDPQGEDHDHDHVAANGIASVSVQLQDPLDSVLLEAWLERLLMLRGADILRLKGVLDVAGEDRRVIVQSVHMMHEGDYGAPWGDTSRHSRLVCHRPQSRRR